MTKENDSRERVEITDRKKEVIDLCLSKLVSKGLTETTVRDLSASLKLKKAGIYWYFKDKDDAIIVCAEAAASKLESALLVPALAELQNPDRMWQKLCRRTGDLAPTMKYFAQVCSTPKYQEKMVPVLSKLSDRLKVYTARFAEKLGYEAEQFEPYFYTCITVVSNFMIFNDEPAFAAQMKFVRALIGNNKRTDFL